MRKNLQQERKQKRLTQAEIANIIGITTRHYNALEAGSSDGSIKIWCRLSELFHKSIDYLLRQETTGKKQGEGDSETKKISSKSQDYKKT